MLFRRRIPANWREKLRILLWPRRSWSRSARYVSKRILRLTGSPHAIAAGVAAGVFASFTPFMGFHFITAFLVAYVIAGNFAGCSIGYFFWQPHILSLYLGLNLYHGKFHPEPRNKLGRGGGQ